MDPEDMTIKECLERANQVANNNRINESSLYWIDAAIEKLEAVEERLEEVEDDERLGYDDAEVQVNAPLALIQTSLKVDAAIEKLEAVEERLEEVEDDERLGYDDAEVQVNAPLALIQTSLKAKRDSMRFALDP